MMAPETTTYLAVWHIAVLRGIGLPVAEALNMLPLTAAIRDGYGDLEVLDKYGQFILSHPKSGRYVTVIGSRGGHCYAVAVPTGIKA